MKHMYKNQRIRAKKNAKLAAVGDECICGGCGNGFTKEHYNQLFCKQQPKTVCKDRYWNNVDENKRNNTTRISPASAQWMGWKSEQRKWKNEEAEIAQGEDYLSECGDR